MDIGTIDYFAHNGSSFLHRASARNKVIFVALVLASIIITNNLILLVSVYLGLMALVILTRLNFLKIVSIASYPAIFALLFVIAGWNGNWVRSGVIIFKALVAALSMVLLIVTTPYPNVFAVISPFLPRIVVEGLFVTYRSLFILLELIDNLILALRVRGGLSPRRYLKNIVNFSSGIGLLLIRGFELAERLYGVMRIRGYSGNISGLEGHEFGKGKNVAPIIIGIFIFAFSLAARVMDNVSSYSFYLLLFSLLSVIVSFSYVYLSRDRGLNWKSW